MAIRAGSIVLVAGNNVVDRLQSHGLGDVRLPVEVIRETGNDNIVDKVIGEPDFTFSLEAWDTTTEFEAFLTGKLGSQASASSPGAGDADGTEYKLQDMLGCFNIASPWKNQATGSAGVVSGGHLVPGYYATSISYRFGVTDNASQTAQLGGGSFYYGLFAPREEQFSGTGAQVAFTTTDPAVHYREGGSTGTTFKSVFGVIVDGVLQIEDVDYTVTGGGANPGSAATVTFTNAPANGASVRFAYFTSTAKAYPDTVHASTIIKPAAVRGRNIVVRIKPFGGSTLTKIASVQSVELNATIDGTVEREMGNEDPTGRTVNGTDTNGTITVRSKDSPAFFTLMKQITGVDTDNEVLGWLNQNQVELEIEIQNPKNPGQILKTLYVSDAKFQVPGTPARVNTSTDFAIGFESESGNFSAFKGARS